MLFTISFYFQILAMGSTVSPHIFKFYDRFKRFCLFFQIVAIDSTVSPHIFKFQRQVQKFLLILSNCSNVFNSFSLYFQNLAIRFYSFCSHFQILAISWFNSFTSQFQIPATGSTVPTHTCIFKFQHQLYSQSMSRVTGSFEI